MAIDTIHVAKRFHEDERIHSWETIRSEVILFWLQPRIIYWSSLLADDVRTANKKKEEQSFFLSLSPLQATHVEYTQSIIYISIINGRNVIAISNFIILVFALTTTTTFVLSCTLTHFKRLSNDSLPHFFPFLVLLLTWNCTLEEGML